MPKRRAKKGSDERRMSLGEHLIELRKRLVISALAILVGAVAGWFLSDLVWDALRVPIEQIALEQGREANINYGDITSAFDLKLQIAFFLAILLASPVWLYQIWAFLAQASLARKSDMESPSCSLRFRSFCLAHSRGGSSFRTLFA